MPGFGTEVVRLSRPGKVGIQHELVPPVVGGATEVVTLPETLEQPQLSLMNYASEAGTFMGTCPDCSSQLEFAEGCKKCHACGYSECG